MMAQLEMKLQRAAALHSQGAAAQAAGLYREILAVNPDHADALHLLGVAETQLGRAQQGLDLIERSLAINSEQPVAIANLGNAQLALDRPLEALASYERALRMKPDYALALFGQGNALFALDRPIEALASLDRTLAVAPSLAAALNARGAVLLKLKRPQDAIASYERAIQLFPGFAQALCGHGNALSELGQTDMAIEAYDRALGIDPTLTAALMSRGIALSTRARFSEAIESFERLRELDSSAAYAPGAHLHAKLQICDWAGFERAASEVIGAVERDGRGDFPFSFLAVCDSPALQRRCAREYAANFSAPQQPLWTGETYSHERVRVAYVSADFLEHPTSYLMAGVFEKHDRQHFETIAIALREDERSPTARRVRAAFDRFVVAGSRSDAEIALLMREMEIDVAVDLMGYTGEHRTNILAHRPAPVQINYLGFPATMGAADIDYIIADRFLIPPECEADYDERVVYLPDCFQANDDRRPVAPQAATRAAAGLPEGSFVWCSFHSIYKLNPPMFDVWARLLRATPGSVLWLVARDVEVERNLRHEASARGVDPERLVYAQSLPYPRHLARLPLADLCLDTLPFNGGATTSDALWAGLPVLTCAGKGFAARMSGSLLQAVGLGGLVTPSLQEYERLALQLAHSPQRLAALRDKLVGSRATSRLFDTDRFRRHLEAAYVAMLERTRRGEPPARLAISPMV